MANIRRLEEVCVDIKKKWEPYIYMCVCEPITKMICESKTKPSKY